MADNWTQSIICRYYKNGICREGDNCRYNHARVASNDTLVGNTNDTPPRTTGPSTTCRFFKWGSCKFGANCRFAHGAKEDTTKTNSKLNRGESSVGTSDCASTSSSSSESVLDKTKEGTRLAEDWVKAPEFVPSFGTSGLNVSAEESTSKTGAPTSYARAVCSSGQTSNPASEPLCPYAEASGICKKIDCPYLHGIMCEMCGRAALHPFNDELRQQHTNACIKQHEADMELSFAIQRSRDKSCGVCFEVIMEKSTAEQRFGILPNCNHCFCLGCIRKWRQATQFENKIIRSCPECRVPSDFVCPSTYWVDTKEEKEKLIVEYKEALSLKDCKYFNKGRGKCPFGNKCFYLHALPDGTKTDVGPPVRQDPPSDDDWDFYEHILLWNFLEVRDNQWVMMDDRDEVVFVFSDSEDSDWSG
ncbi:probable E3 ubiquitin-protein ligase makorin-1 isoform X2 [Venturia canescens]|uniref:probable E3 ubiquitin-protein ligase makorin-1 isoform X2 n=1 Tax=Venturia canescens TaxID=32260 RepID=UPI001C9D27CF|nr:probable E3 ubiquitin-protein ligase makorin-1 isoform X2 [Venturia canescens]